MIIDCPNCQAQYDIDEATPVIGRKVRCSNCANVWVVAGAPSKAAAETTAPKPKPDSVKAASIPEAAPDRAAPQSEIAQPVDDPAPHIHPTHDNEAASKGPLGTHQSEAGSNSDDTPHSSSILDRESVEAEAGPGKSDNNEPVPQFNDVDAPASSPPTDNRDHTSQPDTGPHAGNIQRSTSQPANAGEQQPAHDVVEKFPPPPDWPTGREPARAADTPLPDSPLAAGLREEFERRTFHPAPTNADYVPPQPPPAGNRPAQFTDFTNPNWLQTPFQDPGPPLNDLYEDAELGYGANDTDSFSPEESTFDQGYDSFESANEPMESIPSTPPARSPGRSAAAWLIGITATVSLIALLWIQREAVVNAVPSSAKIYSAFGSKINLRGLEFSDVHYKWSQHEGRPALDVSGKIHNIADVPQSVPTIVFVLFDGDGAEVYKWATKIGDQQIDPGSNSDFTARIPAPPSVVRNLQVRFARDP